MGFLTELYEDLVWQECSVPRAWDRDRRTPASPRLRGRQVSHTGRDASDGNWLQRRGSWTGTCKMNSWKMFCFRSTTTWD